MSTFSEVVRTETPTSIKPVGSGKSGALLASYRHGVKALVKLSKDAMPDGRKMQRGLPVRTHPLREVAYYRLAKFLGFDDLVPETVLTTRAVDGYVASAQRFVTAHHLNELQPKLKDRDRADWHAQLVDTTQVVPKRFWRQLLALDVIAGARDRHANNVGVRVQIEDDRPVFRLVAWDNAVTFGKTFDRYHNVFHKLLFRRAVNFDDVWSAVDKVTRPVLVAQLGPFLSEEEVDHAVMRAEFFRRDYPHRLPFEVCSQGHDGLDDFPAYRSYFNPIVERPLHLLRISA